jgi:hypothetical protein
MTHSAIAHLCHTNQSLSQRSRGPGRKAARKGVSARSRKARSQRRVGPVAKPGRKRRGRKGLPARPWLRRRRRRSIDEGGAAGSARLSCQARSPLPRLTEWRDAHDSQRAGESESWLSNAGQPARLSRRSRSPHSRCWRRYCRLRRRAGRWTARCRGSPLFTPRSPRLEVLSRTLLCAKSGRSGTTPTPAKWRRFCAK